MRFTTLTTALLASCALAAPTPEFNSQPEIPTNTATCALEYKIYSGRYTVNIGRPYLDGAGCDYVKATLKKHVELATGFKCKDNGHGQTLLTWSTNMKQTKANEGLQAAYPMVSFACDPYRP